MIRRPRGRALALGVSATVMLVIGGCTAGGGAGTMSPEEARAGITSAVDAVVGQVGRDWADEFDPTTMWCSVTGGLDGRQWRVNREGVLDAEPRAAAERAAEVFRGLGFEVRMRESGDLLVEAIGRHPDGRDVQFGARADGSAVLTGQSTCFPE